MSLRVSTLVPLVLATILLPTYGKEIGELVPIVSTSKPIAMPIKMMKPLTFKPEIEGWLAQAKCAENVEAVYGKMKSVSILDQSSVNVSRCAPIDDDTYTMPKEFLHVATLGYNTSKGIVWDCTGSLISAKIVLTTAGCIEEHWDLKWIKIGPISLRDKNQEKLQIIEIEEIIIHPKYKWPHHDIAILRLKHKVNYSEWVRPACLSVNSSDASEGNEVIGVAWGPPYFEGKYAGGNLLNTTLKIIPNDICGKMWRYRNIDKWQICTTSNCAQGCCRQTGGADQLLVIFNDHDCMYNVIGITGFLRICSSVYTGVHNYISWIEKTAWPEYF